MQKPMLTLAMILMMSACSAEPDDQFAGDDGYIDPDAMVLDMDGDNAGLNTGMADLDLGTAEREGFDCKTVNTQTSDGPDVIGVAIGMTADLAFQKIACHAPALDVEYQTSGGFRLASLPDGSVPRKLITVDAAQEEIDAWLVGLPGQEHVVGIRRELSFGDGAEPATEILADQLRDKYGEMIQSDICCGRVVAGVVRTADKRLVPADNASQFRRCLPSTSGSISLKEDCGLSVSFRIEPKDDNPALIKKLTVTMAHGRYGSRLIDEFNEFAANADAERQASELEAARRETDEASGRRPAL